MAKIRSLDEKRQAKAKPALEANGIYDEDEAVRYIQEQLPRVDVETILDVLAAEFAYMEEKGIITFTPDNSH